MALGNVEPATLALVLLAGLAAGVASGLFGVGGGILMVPAARYLAGADFHTARAASLVVIVASSAVGLWTHWRKRSVDLRAGAWCALGGLVATPLAVLAAERVQDALLQALFGIVLVITGARLIWSKAPAAPTRRASAAYCIALGVLGGVLAGFFGVGGGVVVVPGLILASVGPHLAIGTSLVAVLGNALGGTAGLLRAGYGPALLALGLPMALGALPGSWIGAKLAHRLHADALRRLFGAGLILVGLAMSAQSAWTWPG